MEVIEPILYRLPVLTERHLEFFARFDTSGSVLIAINGGGADILVEDPLVCWIWTASTVISNHGDMPYGRFSERGHTGEGAHRISFRWFNGEIPEGFDVDHLCRVTLCVNPCHLEAVTHAENVRRGRSAIADNARKTHCIRGHSLSGDNLGLTSIGTRKCRTCAQLPRYVKVADRTAQIRAYLASLSPDDMQKRVERAINSPLRRLNQRKYFESMTEEQREQARARCDVAREAPARLANLKSYYANLTEEQRHLRVQAALRSRGILPKERNDG